MDAMRNLVNRKNKEVISRKLDEESPDKITRERRTLEETPRTSVDASTTSGGQFKRKPEIIYDMAAIINGVSE